MFKEGWLKYWKGRDCYADYPGVGKVYDKDVADFVVKHLRFIDFFNPKKIAVAAIYAQLMLFGVEEMPKDPNFKW